MRVTTGTLAVVLALFAVFQYDDPDGPVWAAIYGIAAVWCAVAALRPGWLAVGWVIALLGLSLVAAVAGVVVFWPDTAAWWRVDVWWHEETVREGMGFMIVLAALGIAFVTALRRRRGDG